jgi:hypothetical protein
MTRNERIGATATVVIVDELVGEEGLHRVAQVMMDRELELLGVEIQLQEIDEEIRRIRNEA